MKKNDLYAYAGQILRVDLGSGSFTCEPTAKYAREWLGGSGIAWWILYNEVKSWVTPYDPTNRLIISAGPLVGTLAPGACRIQADSINAQTLGVGTSSSDSFFGPQLKYAGYDHIIVQGKARKPVYLWIDDDRVQLRDASALWGLTTYKTAEAIRQELGDEEEIHVISIGPAGENLVREACIIEGQGRAMGRCGLGSVMGSKNLKAMAVRGTGAVEVAEPQRFMESVMAARELFDRSQTSKLIEEYGTPIVVGTKQDGCGIPYKNFQELILPDELLQKINVPEINQSYKVGKVGYPSCPQCCDRRFYLTNGPYAGLKSQGFQFEALANFGGKLAAGWDPTFLIAYNAYCNQMGLGIDLPAGAISWAMECFERGILKESDTDGLKVEWGDAGVIMELTRKIAYREGFGAILADGCARAAEIIGRGSEYYAMHLKGHDLYEVIRPAIGWGLGACVSTRGGGHVTSSPACETSLPIPVDEKKAFEVFGVKNITDPIAYEGKVKLVEYFERLSRSANALGICLFCTVYLDVNLTGFPEMAELYSAATGWKTTEKDLRRITAKILNVEKAFNLLHTNFGRKDDYPPPRDLEEPVPSGKFAGFRLTREKWDELLDEYYEMEGWDKRTSFPTRKCLEDLGLKQVADDLEKTGKIGNS